MHPEGERSVVVTGAGSGIGRGIAEAFAARGDFVHLVDISAESVDRVATEIGGDRVRGHVADVSVLSEISEVVSEAAARSGRLDVLVNAAGVFDGYAGIDDTSPELWDRVMRINVTGCFNGCKAAVAAMPQPGGGRIVTIGSIAAFRGGADGLAYCTSKAALLGMHRRIAVEVASRGITANVICPGATDTAIRETSEQVLGDLFPQEKRVGQPPEVRKWIIPAGRSASPAEMAALAIFLSSEDAGYITGQAICIDGGWTAQ
jgi:3-oxoacyl-[acyl-carrier protein] reductase